jgi:Mn-dependent DtxR family transcriptional regulator
MPTHTADTSVTVEDYLERIYELIEEKGYARVVDIASSLDIAQASVTRMIQKLDEKGLVVYERYRGLVLTPKGAAVARAIQHRHSVLTDFFRKLGVDEPTLQKDVEGIEHHLSPKTFSCLQDLVQFLTAHPKLLNDFVAYRNSTSKK